MLIRNPSHALPNASRHIITSPRWPQQTHVLVQGFSNFFGQCSPGGGQEAGSAPAAHRQAKPKVPAVKLEALLLCTATTYPLGPAKIPPGVGIPPLTTPVPESHSVSLFPWGQNFSFSPGRGIVLKSAVCGVKCEREAFMGGCSPSNAAAYSCIQCTHR